MKVAVKEELSRLLVTGDWNRFARDTMPYWQSLARRMRRRWDVPDAVEECDVAQELLLGAMRSVEKYDPARGDAWTYVRWRAEREARRWLNKQRGSHRYSDRSASRYPLRCDDPEALLTEQPVQERVAVAKQRLAAIVADAGNLESALKTWIRISGAHPSSVDNASREAIRKMLEM